MTDTEMLLETAELLDLVFYDVKHMDDETHREITGASNKKRFCQNLAALAEIHDNIVVRIPVIPGINDSTENLQKTAEYAASLGIPTIELCRITTWVRSNTVSWDGSMP